MRIALIVALLLGSIDAFSQSFYALRRDRNALLTVGSGTSHYFGEMVNPKEFGKTRYNIILGTEAFLTPRISARVEFAYFRLAGDDSQANDDRQRRNLSFFSGNVELSGTAVYNLFPNGRRFYQRPGFNVFVFAGVGVLYTNPKTTDKNGEKHALQPLETEGVHYSRIQPVIPYGLGVKLKINPFFNIIIEGGYRLTFTDYLDDVSSERYPDPAILKSDLSRELSDRRLEKDPTSPIIPGLGKRGNPENNDGYFLGNVKIQYYLPYKLFNKRPSYGTKKSAGRKTFRYKPYRKPKSNR